ITRTGVHASKPAAQAIPIVTNCHNYGRYCFPNGNTLYRNRMTTITILLSITIVLLLANTWLLFKDKASGSGGLEKEIFRIVNELARMDTLVRDEFSRNREETQRNAKENRAELSQSLKIFGESLQASFRDSKDELSKSLKSMEDRFSQNVNDFNTLQRQKFTDLLNLQHQIKGDTESKLDKIKEAVESNLQKIQEQNSKKLD